MLFAKTSHNESVTIADVVAKDVIRYEGSTVGN